MMKFDSTYSFFPAAVKDAFHRAGYDLNIKRLLYLVLARPQYQQAVSSM